MAEAQPPGTNWQVQHEDRVHEQTLLLIIYWLLISISIHVGDDYDLKDTETKLGRKWNPTDMKSSIISS